MSGRGRHWNFHRSRSLDIAGVSLEQATLVEKRELLRAWQNRRWYALLPEDYVRLHLGCGGVHLPGALNVDLRPDADVCMDIREYPYKRDSVDDIICQHVLEHLPMRDAVPLIRKWAGALKPGGVVEIGVPDMDLMADAWLKADEAERWTRYAWTIYGGQSDEAPVEPWRAEQPPYNPHQTHQSAFTLGYLVRQLEAAGLRMIDAFWYDGHNTPSAFALAQKPPLVKPTLLEQWTVMGAFTHRTEYLPGLWASANKYLPQVQTLTQIAPGTPINRNMAALRKLFQATGKRFWLFLDDDIQFLNSDIVHRAIELLLREGYAAVSAYSTFDPAVLGAAYSRERPGLVARETAWATGYFILVDSWRVGHIEPDANLPDGNTAVDTSYSVAIRAAGHRIGIVDDYVYHTRKDVWAKPDVIKVTNDYLFDRWGQFYFDVAQYDGNVLEW